MSYAWTGGQVVARELYDASGSVGATSALALAASLSRSFLLIQNTHATQTLSIEFGGARGTATVTSGAVASVAVANAGQGYSFPPTIEFLGGGVPTMASVPFQGNIPLSDYVGLGQDGAPSPSQPALAHCVMTGAAPNMSISSIVVDDGGSGYVAVPYVYIRNDPRDPNGHALATAAAGVLLPAAGGLLRFDNGFVPTAQISVIGSGASTTYSLKYSV